MRSHKHRLRNRLMIPTALVLVSTFTCFTSPVAASNEINLDEIPSGVAVSNSGQTVVGLANLRRGIIVKTNGSTTAFDVQCSVSDVEVNPTATRGWSICNDSTYLTVLALTTGEISAMDTKVSNAFDIEFSDSGKLLVVLGGSGQLGIISDRSDADYELKSVSVGESAAGLALSRNGRQAFVSTDSGKLIVVDTRSGRIQKFPILRKQLP